MGSAETPPVAVFHDFCMRYVIKGAYNIPEIFFCGEPIRAMLGEVIRHRITGKRFFAVVLEIFVEIGHCELPYISVYGVTIAKYRVVCFAECPPAPIMPEERYYMVFVITHRI